MTPEEYRELCAKRSSPMEPRLLNADELRLLLYALGTTGEAGEIADEVKKHLFHDKPLDAEHLLKECGDTIWYIDKLLACLGFTMSDCLQRNNDKLEARYPNGWAAATQHFGWTDESQK